MGRSTAAQSQARSLVCKVMSLVPKGSIMCRKNWCGARLGAMLGLGIALIFQGSTSHAGVFQDAGGVISERSKQVGGAISGSGKRIGGAVSNSGKQVQHRASQVGQQLGNSVPVRPTNAASQAASRVTRNLGGGIRMSKLPGPTSLPTSPVLRVPATTPSFRLPISKPTVSNLGPINTGSRPWVPTQPWKRGNSVGMYVTHPSRTTTGGKPWLPAPRVAAPNPKPFLNRTAMTQVKTPVRSGIEIRRIRLGHVSGPNRDQVERVGVGTLQVLGAMMGGSKAGQKNGNGDFGPAGIGAGSDGQPPERDYDHDGDIDDDDMDAGTPPAEVAGSFLTVPSP